MTDYHLSLNYHDTIVIIGSLSITGNYHHYHTPLGVIMMIMPMPIDQMHKESNYQTGMYTNVYSPCLQTYT